MTQMVTLFNFIINLLLPRKEIVFMVDMYLALVIAGRRTCNPDNKNVTLVPANYRSLVLVELTALGLDADGKPIA